MKIAERARQKPKRYHSYVQSKTVLRQSEGTLEDPGDGLSVSDYEKCDTLRRYFETVYEEDDGRAVPREFFDTPPMGDVEVSVSSVLDAMEGLNVNKPAGVHWLHPAIIKPRQAILNEEIGCGQTVDKEPKLRKNVVPAEARICTLSWRKPFRPVPPDLT
ncbi:unnamed protein product [Echinostoma caproni]|uniref:Enhancer of polycomb-like protein n=1 Tax=Echinostoma caproni TaxID=27848 RepID=A0A183BAW0_9TREM|nr:unnamed protein product [Echinostoma caproni]